MAEERQARDVWAIGAAYESYVGRWSRLVARELLRWLRVPSNSRWLDVGCGTGTLVEAIAEHTAPRAVLGIDRSKGFIAHARARVTDARVAFDRGRRALDTDGVALVHQLSTCEQEDAVVSGLVLNFVSEPAKMVAEMVRAGRPGSAIALYVWDYAAGMELMRCFWNAAKALEPAAAALDEAVRFPGCAPAPLEALFTATGLSGVATRAIDVHTRFQDFDDFWSPFLGGQGPAPAYAMSLPEGRRVALREAIRASLPIASDGSILLKARAWAVRGSKADIAAAR